MTLDGKKVAILIAPQGTEEREFVQPRDAVNQAGASLTVIGLEKGEAKTNNHDVEPGGSYAIDAAIGDVSADDFDALILPGGCVGADKLRASEEVVAFVRAFFEQQKPVAAICHAPWLLVEANVVHGRTLTSFPSIKTDIGNAGGDWVDREVVVDNGLITSRNPHDLPAFCAKIIEEFGEGLHAAQAQGV
ncbi:protease I [Sphingomonas vulcanisoli]|uniref:Protease I n=1 Tax=Sphingomonas vulcanisoli TaxID=1658060 RepID=A0ABX0TSB7_9SPHN|nr:type 1 glutamine amidotransferase domain-containing protein [Sphingomonas vulcanisoli]NIJ06506.1 protease I [Sphingomonas vulcanisoli]